MSCLITAHHGSANRTLLFDSGPEADTFERNTRQLGIDLGNVEAVVLSHGHWDHAGGLLRAIDMIRSDGKNRDLPYYAHPDMFRPRGRQLPDGGIMPMEDVPSIAELTAHGARVVATREPQAPLDGMFYVSGEIPRVTPFETGLPFHYAKTESGWEPDPWIIDERWLGVHVAGKGLIVFTACSHAGVINVLKDARAKHPDIPLYCVLGGFHLSGATEKIIPETVAAIGRVRPDVYRRRALHRLAGDGGAGQRVRRSGGDADGGRQTLRVLSATRQRFRTTPRRCDSRFSPARHSTAAAN